MSAETICVPSNTTHHRIASQNPGRGSRGYAAPQSAIRPASRAAVRWCEVRHPLRCHPRMGRRSAGSVANVARELHQVQNPRMPPRVRGGVEDRQHREAQQAPRTDNSTQLSIPRAGRRPGESPAARAGSARRATAGRSCYRRSCNSASASGRTRTPRPRRPASSPRTAPASSRSHVAFPENRFRTSVALRIARPIRPAEREEPDRRQAEPAVMARAEDGTRRPPSAPG